MASAQPHHQQYTSTLTTDVTIMNTRHVLSVTYY